MLGDNLSRATAASVIFKNAVIILGEIAVFLVAIWQLVQGQWLWALGLFFIGGPVVYFVLDILTGLVVLPIMGVAGLRDRRSKRASSTPGDWLDHAARNAVLERAQSRTGEAVPVEREIELVARRHTAFADEGEKLLLSTCVVLGYLWRRAEHELVPDKAAFAEIEAAVREDARKGAELAIATLNESNPEHRGLDRYWALYWGAAARSANDMSPANLGSIGGREAGEETLSWAFREMTDYLPRVSRGATDVIRRRAFNFGIHVADVEYVSA